MDAVAAKPVDVSVCVGTSCFLRGSQNIISGMTEKIESEGWKDRINLKATFCSENCSLGPTVTIGDRKINHADLEKVTAEVEAQLGITDREGVLV